MFCKIKNLREFCSRRFLPQLLDSSLLPFEGGEVSFFNKSYQKDDPCETAPAVRPRPSNFKRTKLTQSIALASVGSTPAICHHPNLTRDNLSNSAMMVSRSSACPASVCWMTAFAV